MAVIRTELHRHLDVSLRMETLLTLAQERGLEAQDTGLEAFREKIVLREPKSDLASVLATFELFQCVLDHHDVLERVAFEAVEDCRAEGTQRVELRFSPGFVCTRSGMPWEEALDGFEAGLRRGMEKYPEMKAGLICIASRDRGDETVARTVEFFLRHQERFIGLDLAGNETAHPARNYAAPFQEAKKRGARITAHAGEGAGPESVWETLEYLGAERIGHGIRSIEDPKLVEHLIKSRITLETCPTSNWITQAVRTIEEHPLPKLLRTGVSVTINTDDPAVFGSYLPDEIRICRERLGMTDAEIETCFENANRATFLH